MKPNIRDISSRPNAEYSKPMEHPKTHALDIGPLQGIPFRIFSSTIFHQCLHALYSMKGLLLTVNLGSTHIAAQDIAANFGLEEPLDDLVNAVRQNAKTTAESAAIVFVHSICDSAIFQLIELLARYDDHPWIPFISKKQVSFEEISSSSIGQVRDRLLKDYLEVLERKSLPEKVEMLFAVLKPTTVSGVVPTFDFKMADLEAIHELRRRIVHEPHFGTSISDVPVKLAYLVKTLKLLLVLAERKYPGV